MNLPVVTGSVVITIEACVVTAAVVSSWVVIIVGDETIADVPIVSDKIF